MAGESGNMFVFDNVSDALGEVQQILTNQTPHIPSESPNRPPSLTIPNQGSEEYSRYEHILRAMQKYNTIADIPYHIKVVVEECLNEKKFDRSDWKGMASRLEMKGSFIEKLEKDSVNPCKDVFDQLSNKKVVLFLQVLYQMERHDVLDIIYRQLPKPKTKVTPRPSPSDKRENYRKSTKHPSQESTPESTGSDKFCSFSPVSPYRGPSSMPGAITPKSSESDKKSLDSGMHSPAESGRCRSDSSPTTHSDGHTHLVNVEHLSKVNFHSEASKNVWKSIAPKEMSSTKAWKDFQQFLKENFHKESRQSQILRFICYVLRIGDYEERDTKFIKDQDFANMVAWFGPFESGKDGCLERMNKLMKDSVTYQANIGSHSFFAGYMSKDEADNAIQTGDDGTFLVRFSSTNASRGSFVVVLKTPHGPEHHEITQNGANPLGQVEFDGKTYHDLVQLYRKRLGRGGVSSDSRTSCSIICRNLPLNAMFKSYLTGPVSTSSSAGRGRGRGRGATSQE